MYEATDAQAEQQALKEIQPNSLALWSKRFFTARAEQLATPELSSS